VNELDINKCLTIAYNIFILMDKEKNVINPNRRLALKFILATGAAVLVDIGFGKTANRYVRLKEFLRTANSIYENQTLSENEKRTVREILKAKEFQGPFRVEGNRIADGSGREVQNFLGINIFDLTRCFGAKFRDLPPVSEGRLDEVLTGIRQAGFGYVRFLFPREVIGDDQAGEMLLKIFTKLKDHRLLGYPTLESWWRNHYKPALPELSANQLEDPQFIRQAIEWARLVSGVLVGHNLQKSLVGVNILNEPSMGRNFPQIIQDLLRGETQEKIIGYIQPVSAELKQTLPNTLITSNLLKDFNAGFGTRVDLWLGFTSAIDTLSFSCYPDTSFPASLIQSIGEENFSLVEALFKNKPVQIDEFSLRRDFYQDKGPQFCRLYAQDLGKMMHMLANPALLGFWSVQLDEHCWEPEGERRYSLTLPELNGVMIELAKQSQINSW